MALRDDTLEAELACGREETVAVVEVSEVVQAGPPGAETFDPGNHASCVSDSVTNRPPRLPGDAQDHGRDHEGDQWVPELEPDRDDGGAQNHTEAHIGIRTRVVAVGHQGWAVELSSRPRANERRKQIPEEANRSCEVRERRDDPELPGR